MDRPANLGLSALWSKGLDEGEAIASVRLLCALVRAGVEHCYLGLGLSPVRDRSQRKLVALLVERF